MKTFLTLILLLFCATPILAQTASVKGKVVDDKNNPLPLVTVLLYTEGSGQPSAGTSTDDDGLFLLNNLVAGNYTLEFSYIGYHLLPIVSLFLKHLTWASSHLLKHPRHWAKRSWKLEDQLFRKSREN